MKSIFEINENRNDDAVEMYRSLVTPHLERYCDECKSSFRFIWRTTEVLPQIQVMLTESHDRDKWVILQGRIVESAKKTAFVHKFVWISLVTSYFPDDYNKTSLAGDLSGFSEKWRNNQ